MRFVIVGGVSFLVDYGLLALLSETVFKGIPSGYLYSQVLSFTVSLIIHYFLASLWAFRRHSTKGCLAHAKKSGYFALTNLVGLGINEILLYIGSALLGFHYMLVKLVAAFFVMCWNYLTQKFFVFR